MDYELHVSELESKKEKFGDLKESADALVEACNDIKITGELSSLQEKVKTASEKISKGYTRYESWINGYVNDLKSTENTLASGIKAPTLKGDFTNPFAKILIPILKSNASDSEKKTVKSLGDKGPSTSEYAIPPHTNIASEERAKRLAVVGGECSTEADQNAKMTTIQVPYWNGQSVSTMDLTVNKNLVDNYTKVFQKLADEKFTVFPEETSAYDYYHPTRPSGAASDHTLGSAIDINCNSNWNAGDGSSHSVRGKEKIIEIFASEGFYWGGDWTNPDDMHFSWTGY